MASTNENWTNEKNDGEERKSDSESDEEEVINHSHQVTPARSPTIIEEPNLTPSKLRGQTQYLQEEVIEEVDTADSLRTVGQSTISSRNQSEAYGLHRPIARSRQIQMTDNQTETKQDEDQEEERDLHIQRLGEAIDGILRNQKEETSRRLAFETFILEDIAKQFGNLETEDETIEETHVSRPWVDPAGGARSRTRRSEPPRSSSREDAAAAAAAARARATAAAAARRAAAVAARAAAAAAAKAAADKKSSEERKAAGGGGGGGGGDDDDDDGEGPSRRGGAPGGGDGGGRGGLTTTDRQIRPQWPLFDVTATHIRSFSHLFESHAAVIKWPDTAMKSTFLNLLKGSAQRMGSVFDRQNPDSTYEEVRDHLIQTLDKQSDFTAKTRFYSRKRKKDETLEVYAGELCVLAYAAFEESLNWSTGQVNDRVFDIFMQNIGGDLGMRLRLEFPQNLAEALTTAKNLENLGIKETSPAVVSALGSGGTPTRDLSCVECFICHKLGHMAKTCYSNPSNQGDKRGQQSRGSNRGRGGNRGNRGYYNNNTSGRDHNNNNNNNNNNNSSSGRGRKGRGAKNQSGQATASSATGGQNGQSNPPTNAPSSSQ